MGKIINANKIEKFKRYLSEEEKSVITIEKYIRDVRAFGSYIGMNDITKSSVIAYKAHLNERYAVASANSMIAALNKFFRFCGWNDLCVKQFKVQKETFCPTSKELTKEEFRRLVSAAEKKNNKRLSLVIQTLCATGIRVSELSCITVEAAKQGQATVSCKGKIRIIFIISALQKKLLCYAKAHHITSGEIFVTRTGNSMNRCNVWKEMKNLCALADVLPGKVFPHNLRHLFARTFYRYEKDIAKLADILGHSSINTTRIYIVTTGDEHRRRMENMRLVI